MTPKIKDIVPAPEKMKDWSGWYVRSKRPLKNNYFVIPTGTIMRLSTVTINKYLKGFPCECCGVAVSIVVQLSKQEFLRDFDFVILEP